MQVTMSAVILLVLVLLPMFVTSQILENSTGSCIEAGCSSCCFRQAVDCFCDKACLGLGDCCSDIYQLDFCEDLKGSECISGSVRLVNGSIANEGLLEICIFQSWHPVCDYLFSKQEADVACRWLGYSSATNEISSEEIADDVVNSTYGVMCGDGNETDITNCLVDRNFCEASSSKQPFISCFQAVLPFFELSQENSSVFNGVDDDTRRFEFPTPFLFKNVTYNEAYISSNGLISFETRYSDFSPETFPLDSSDIVIAPYWDDIDLSYGFGNIYYTSYDADNDNDVDILTMVSIFITNDQHITEGFDALSAVVVLWSDVCPYPDSQCTQASSFQVVLVSDANSSYAVFTYKCGSLNWINSGAGIGYSFDTEFYRNHVLSRRSIVNDIACVNVERTGSPWSNFVYRVDEGRVESECVSDTVRFVRGSKPNEGRIELCVSEIWHPVCNYGTQFEANIICRELGYQSAEDIDTIDDSELNEINIANNFNELFGVSCNMDSETMLEECSINTNLCRQLSTTQQLFLNCSSSEISGSGEDIASGSGDTLIDTNSCTAECNPMSDEIQYESCCDPVNYGSFIKVVRSGIHRGYIVCPANRPDWCSP